MGGPDEDESKPSIMDEDEKLPCVRRGTGCEITRITLTMALPWLTLSPPRVEPG